MMALGLAAAAMSLPLAAHAAETPIQPRIIVTGEGEASVAPDMALISLSVMREAKTAREALGGQLAAELGMSKTPVHAALERLESEGLVTVSPQQGVVVRALSMKGIADHYEIREALEEADAEAAETAHWQEALSQSVMEAPAALADVRKSPMTWRKVGDQLDGAEVSSSPLKRALIPREA